MGFINKIFGGFKSSKNNSKKSKVTVYVCSNCGYKSNSGGKCPNCGIPLRKEGEISVSNKGIGSDKSYKTNIQKSPETSNKPQESQTPQVPQTPAKPQEPQESQTSPKPQVSQEPQEPQTSSTFGEDKKMDQSSTTFPNKDSQQNQRPNVE